MPDEAHLSDQELLAAADGELDASDIARCNRHLSQCWACRAHKQELENAVSTFVRFYREEHDPQLPSPDGPRAMLRAQMAHIANHPQDQQGRSWRFWRMIPRETSYALAGLVIVIAGAAFIYLNLGASHSDPQFALPKSSVTPGAVVRIDRDRLCGGEYPNNKMVPASLQHEVFREYGIRNTRTSAYEVDYLITPALGGADDIHNLWPQPYSSAWNAHVKDALEDRMRDMVCRGDLDLSAAQQEIASDWIAAYRKYFHTDSPTVTEQ